MDTIDRYPFTNWTIEASFCLSIAEGDRIVLSKEEDRQGILVPQLQLGVFGNEGVIGVEMMDTSDRLIELKSDIVARADEWWHVAVTCDDGQLRLYVAKDSDSPGEYRLVGKRQVADTLTRRRGTWLVGRGCESGKIGRDFLGWIDEVRITTKALKPSQFLFAPGE